MEAQDSQPSPATLLRILVVDDDRSICRMLSMCLEEAGHTVTGVSNAEDALAEARRRVFDVAFLDLRLGIVDGTDVLRELRRLAPWLRVVMMTAYGSIESAVESMRLGAVEYLAKPFDCARARVLATRYGELIGMERRLARFEQKADAASLPPASLSPVMQRVLDEARSAAASEATILLTGESGTGKSLLARAMHAWSARAAGPFVTVSCPAIPVELFESELFGHRRGAFTGAVQDAHGRVAQADGGTLFLDEIGELPLPVQSKLLRFLQDRGYERVGDPATHTANVRLIAATNRGLEQAVAAGGFREDLFYRLNVITLELPPLRERREDIPALAEHFLRHFAAENRRTLTGFTPAAAELLRSAPWPGNIRELRNAIERAVILGSDALIEVHAFSPALRESERTSAAGDRLTLEQLQEAHIRRVLADTPSLQDAADLLGIDQATLWRKRKQYGL
jgi:NtrC-family two-component system response regulator AlgB